jgi:hypothetical protein
MENHKPGNRRLLAHCLKTTQYFNKKHIVIFTPFDAQGGFIQILLINRKTTHTVLLYGNSFFCRSKSHISWRGATRLTWIVRELEMEGNTRN